MAGSTEPSSSDEECSLPDTMFLTAEKDFSLQVGVCIARQLHVQSLESTQSMTEYLENQSENASRNGSFQEHGVGPTSIYQGRFFLIYPTYGWGRLQITQHAMYQLIEHCRVFPSFFKYLRVFGEKSFARDEGFGGYEAINNHDDAGDVCGFESCFLWKYVEPGGCDGRFVYTIRQALIYQNFAMRNRHSTNILVRAPRKLTAQMKKVLNATNGESEKLLGHWTSLQMMCVGSGLDEWRKFLNYLDGEVAQLFDGITMSSTNAVTHDKADELQHRLTEMKRLQFYIDQLLRACHMLDLNKTTIGAMMRAFGRRRAMLQDPHELQQRLEDIQQEYDYLIKMSKNVLDRAVMLSGEARDTVALRNHEINKETNVSNVHSTQAIVELARGSACEARILKSLSVVAAVYLPASFAADFLQMDYLSVAEGGKFAIQAADNMVLYAILVVPLLIVTLSIYIFCELINRRKRVQWRCSSLEPLVGSV